MIRGVQVEGEGERHCGPLRAAEVEGGRCGGWGVRGGRRAGGGGQGWRAGAGRGRARREGVDGGVDDPCGGREG